MNAHRRIGFFQQILILVFLLGLLAILAGQQQAAAQDDNGVSLSARAGFDGYCKGNTWLPVRITVANSGPDLNARVQVSYRDANGSTSLNGADVSLPATSKKEFYLYLAPQNSFRNLKVNLLVKEKSIAEAGLKATCLSDDNLLAGLLADESSPYDILNEVKTLNGSVRLAHLQIADLPDQPQGWDGLDILVIAGQDTGTFAAAQHQALRSWLANGGKLLVIGGLGWQNTTSGLEDILPLSIDSTQKVGSLSALQAYSGVPLPEDAPGLLAVGQVHPQAGILVEQDGFPLITQNRVGLGAVYFFAADPSLRPLADWEGMQDLYSHLLTFKVPKPIWANGRWDTYAANEALSTLSELGIPSIFYVCGWLAVYIVIIGPVNYLILRRMKRGELAWLTIPALVLVFTCVAYFFGFFYRGTKPILNRIAVVQAWEETEQARVRGVVGLYSPNRAKYTLELGDQFLFYPFLENSFQQNGDWQTVQQGTTTRLPDVQVEIGGMKTVSVEGNVTAMTFDHDLVLTVDAKSPYLSGTITNTSGFPLKNAILVTPGAMKKLGDLMPDVPREVNASLVAGKNGPQIYSQDVWSLLGLDTYYDRDVDRDELRQSAILRAILYSNYEEAKTMWGTYLIGWVEQPLLPVGLQDRQVESIDTGLYIMMLSPSLHIEAGSLKLPPNLFTWESTVENISPYYADSSYFPAGGYTFRFRLAVPVRYREVSSLTLHMDSSAASKDVQVYVWDFEQKSWVQLENLTWGNTNIPDPWLYVGPDGETRLKVVGDENSWMEMGPSNFTLGVEQ